MRDTEIYIPSVTEAVKMIVLYYQEKNYKGLRSVKEYLENETTSKYIAGDPDRFHNATVTLTAFGFFDYAYALAQVGHLRYPKNTDLLGDLLCYGLQCRGFAELEDWCKMLDSINKRFWTWRAYRFSFDYWMARLPEAGNDRELAEWEEKINSIINDYKNNFKYINDKSECEKAYMMEYEYLSSKGEEESALKSLIDATEKEPTKNKCPQCALKLADHYFELGDYSKALSYADKAVLIKEDQPSISLGFAYYIRAMSKEYIERSKNGVKQSIEAIYNAYDSAYLHLIDEREDREHLVESVKKQVKILERETGVLSGIDFNQ